MMDKNAMLLETFNFRHACKSFNPNKKVSDKDMFTILEAGRLSPSSFGFEPWKFLLIENEELKKKLYPIAWGAQNSFNGASHFIIILARKKIDTIYSSSYIAHMMNDIQHLPKNIIDEAVNNYKHFQEHDFNLLESERSAFDWACRQTYIALGNMLTAAAFLGIDSCPIEGFNKDAVEELLSHENIVDLTHFGVSVMASFGYRTKAPRAKTRQPMNEVVQRIK